jgi:endonuclease/exonuclease/phosphatase family metal-dependent hydrolase
MPPFPKPLFSYNVQFGQEVNALLNYLDNAPGRKIPKPHKDNLRIASWNIANLGAQKREDEHLKLIAEIISWFDVIAIQEAKENYSDLEKITAFAGADFRNIFSDDGGNKERLAFIYNTKKVSLLAEIAELALPPADYKNIRLADNKQVFTGFDRSPYLINIKTAGIPICLLNVHLYFGDEKLKDSIDRRCLEAFAVARWAYLRSKSKYAYGKNVLALGDFNLPKIDPEDAVYKALISKGLQLPSHTSKAFSNISNDKQYDQIAFLPGFKKRILEHGIFDFDSAVFADLYREKTPVQFRSYIRYYISDHRPMWLELDIKQ